MAYTQEQYQGAGKWIEENLNNPALIASEIKRLGLTKDDILKSVQTVRPEYTMGNVDSWFSTQGMNPWGSTDNADSAIDPSQSTLSPNFADYVYRMLAKGEAAADLPYQPYTGERFAGPSDLQKKAFSEAENLKTPDSFANASAAAEKALQGLGNLAYTPTTFTDPYKAPDAYDPTKFTTEEWSTAQAQQYMNPFLQAALDPQLRELTRKADIARLGDATRLTQAGAFGGSRQAIMEAEGRRNLLGEQSGVLAKGYKDAYDLAQTAFKSDQERAMEAQRQTESSKQYGYTQGMTAADRAAQYGLDTQRAQETANQFGANYGLSALNAAMSGATALSGIGTAESTAGLANLKAKADLGAVQQGLAQQPLDFGYQQWQESMKYPFQQATYMQSLLQGLPLQAQAYNSGASGFSSALQGGLLGLGLANAFGTGTTGGK